MSKVVPVGWKEEFLKDLSTVITKGTTPTTYGTGYVQAGIKFIRVENISKDGFIDETNLRFISPETHSNLKRSQLKAGDLLISIAGAIGRSAIVSDKNLPANTNQAIGIVRLVQNKIDPEFARYSIQSPLVLQQISDSQAGNAQVNLNLEQLGGLRLCCPPLSEQQKIATILSSVDNVIEKTRTQIDKLKDLKTGMMQELLTKGIGHTEFKDTPVGRIPKTWKVFTIEDILESIIDYRGKSPPKSETGIPLITAKNIRQGYIDVDPKEYIYEEQYNSWMVRGFPVEGDVFITTEAPLGNVARVPTYKFAIGQRVLTLRPKEFVATDYLFYMMQGQYFREQLDLESTGSTVAGIKQSIFRNILVPLPSKTEQQEIAKPLNALNQQIDAVQEKLQGMEAMKKALMQDLLAGKVRTQYDIDMEAAHV